MTGLGAALASLPVSASVRGGLSSPETGITDSSPVAKSQPPQDASQEFQGLGPFLENDDASVFKTVDGLVMRYEIIAQSHLAQDSHWLHCVLGYPWSTLYKDPGRDSYRQELPYGSASITIQAVPNKTWDMVRKATTTVLGDFPEADCEPLSDSDDAKNACDMANRFLSQDAGEQGTNDAVLWAERVERSLCTSSTYLEVWTDATGGGYVPLSISAHPLATDPDHAETAPDGTPTTDMVDRYVTAPTNPQWTPQSPPDVPSGRQFTDDPEQAAPQWMPKLRVNRWGREHLRVYPETARVEDAEKVIVLGYCTLGEAKRRWSTVAAMESGDLNILCNWTPTRYTVLLPPFLRARWGLTDGRDKEKGASPDERIMFYYHVYVKACPDYPKGADLVITGAFSGKALDKDTLSRPVQVDKGRGETTEVRCMEIPVVQITPVSDPYELDPTGRAFVEMFAGAAENSAFLTSQVSDIINQISTQPYAINSTSPISGKDIKRARSTRDMLLIKRAEDKPTQLTPPAFPGQFFQFVEMADEAINSIAAQERASQGADNAKERSGKALQIAVNQNNVANTGLQNSVMGAYARYSRIKLERCMSSFTTQQQIGYVGQDGSYQQKDFVGVDFALVGKVSIKAGTGTMLTPDGKVQYLGNLKQAGLLADDEVQEAARPAFSKRLGLPPNPHEQYVERCLESWTEGPPEPEAPAPLPALQPGVVGQIPQQSTPARSWEQSYDAYKQEKAKYDAAMQAFQQQTVAFQTYQHNAALVAGGPPPEKLGPEQQNATAMLAYQMAVQAIQQGQQQAAQRDQAALQQYQQTAMQAQAQGQPVPPPPVPSWPPVAPQQPQLTPPVEPWNPFIPRPNDATPLLATIWERKCSRMMSTTKYSKIKAMYPNWASTLDQAWTRAGAVLQQAQAAAHPEPAKSA